MRRLGILGSTRGTNMLDLIEAIRQKRLNAKIEVVASNVSDALILQNARMHQLPAEFIDPKKYSREEFDSTLSKLFKSYNVELIVLIGYMRILSKPFVIEWREKIINVHPSVLPAFAGGMDKNVHQAVLDSGIKETGCTIHYVTEEVDQGPILLQKKCMVLKRDTVDTLKARVQELEAEALVEVIGTI